MTRLLETTTTATATTTTSRGDDYSSSSLMTLGRVTLPLLSSLSSNTTKPIVQSLLQKYQAQSTIRSFLKRKLKFIPHSSSSSSFPHTVPLASTHFLFQAFNSSSLQIRQTVVEILLEAVESPKQIDQLTQILWDICRDDMVTFLRGMKTHYGFLQIYGLLSHYILSPTENHHDLFYTFLVKHNVLHWLSRHALEMVTMLVQNENRVSSRRSSSRSSDSLDSNGTTVELNQDQVKDRLYVIVHFMFQMICVATKSECMERHELARKYVWCRSASQEGTRIGTTFDSGSSMSPLANLLALFYILRNKGSMSLMGKDVVLYPDERVNRVVFMLGKMVDIHGQVILIPETKDDGTEKGKEENESMNDSPRRRSRVEGNSSGVLGRMSGRNGARAHLEDFDPISNDPSERILQRLSGSSSRGNSERDSTTIASRSFSSAAEVMSRTMSFLDRNRRDSEDDSERHDGASSNMANLMNFRLMRDDEQGDDEQDEEESDNDDHDEEENQSQDTEKDDRASEDEIEDDEDDEEEDDEDDDDDDENHSIHQEMHDEEIFSDMEHGGDEAILDNIIVEVASAPYQDEMMILDDIRGDRDEEMEIFGAVRSRDKKNSLDAESSGVKGIKESTKAFRSQVFLRASMEVLEAQYPTHNHNEYNRVLTPAAEQCLLKALCDLVQPPKTPLKLKVFMRRAPTQEEFFRGSLSRNPILISSLTVEQSGGSTNNDASVRDLRQHIANDLQMADSAELLELLVAGKILDMNLKLRVVAQTVWRSHVLENSGNSVPAGSGIRSLLSGAAFRADGLSTTRVDENSPMSDFPPMVVTYRLAGVDGEATEDKIEENDLVDPDAPPDTANLSSNEYEQRMEKEYGLTRSITKGRGIGVLLHSLGSILGDTRKRIRRDDVRRSFTLCGHKVDVCNLARSLFLKNPPCSALILLRHCAMITDNRKKLIKAQAPVVFLRLLLEVLNSINDPVASSSSRPRSMSLSESHEASSSRKDGGNNPTSVALQELIEILASDISNESSKKADSDSTFDISLSDVDFEEEESESSMLLLLSSLRTTSLSPPLRKVIAKLLPFLTYGQLPQSKALASQFITNVPLSFLRNSNSIDLDDQSNDENILIATFIDAACHLPPTAVCDTLRSELIRQGFVADMRDFILEDIPSYPPPWSPALLQKDCALTELEKSRARDAWKLYYGRNGLQTVFKVLIGLARDHDTTQCFLADIEVPENANILKGGRLLTACHWIESTSDKDDVSTNGLGILAEELLDTLLKGNSNVEAKINALRTTTRERKKEIAQDRRKKALSVMTTFSSGAKVPVSMEERKSDSSLSSSTKPAGGKRKREKAGIQMNKKNKPSAAKPAWMLEMEAIEDEKGLVCAICQEGRTYKPTEILGLYAYVKKISISYNKGGGKSLIDGTLMIVSIPSQLPKALQGTDMEEDWYNPSIALASLLRSSTDSSQLLAASGSSITGSRSCYFTTSVTAGNSVHCNCHERARIADRNHPKAPKTEWEGASLRNSRVTCNAILPLISKENAQIPVMSLERALHNYQTVTTNILGSEPNSMVWNILYDLNFLLLRIAYGEPLNNDCGGGSLTSNSALIFYDLFLVDTIARNSEHDSPITVQHARELSTCFLASSSILRSGEMEVGNLAKKLRKGFIESSLMSSICCILFKNAIADVGISGTSKMRWELYKNHFLTGILQLAGRRHALGIESSGCVQPNSKGRGRASSFSEWDYDGSVGASCDRRKQITRKGPSTIELYSKAIRPMVTFYAMIDQVSKDFSLEMSDQDVEASASKLVGVVESCYNAENVSALLSTANISLDHTTIIEEIEIGINSVH